MKRFFIAIAESIRREPPALRLRDEQQFGMLSHRRKGHELDAGRRPAT